MASGILFKQNFVIIPISEAIAQIGTTFLYMTIRN
jgi:hypothetical protein